MDPWDGWPFARVLVLFVGLAFVMMGAQVLLFHWRAAFRKWTMYIPVLGAPALTAAGIAGAIQRDGWIGWAALAFFAIGVFDGMIGVVEHLRGIVERIGGFSPRNVMAGPPVLLPAMFMALSLMGGLSLVWGAL